MAGVSEVENFARLIEALDPWLGQVVIIGGFAHRLYGLHPLAQPLDYQPLGTFDTDIAFPLNLPATGEQLRAAARKGIPRRANGRRAASSCTLSR
jgi:hypothetical protein